ncbi:hypothetical protein BCR39DRAFT_38399 [Naematelia encephala]|uniref:Uncharacterized protein n=1 Tax=Naematelia encephala TaxID=71784 RepID=A0A1Y2BMA2_9TREE|nr:hypothetical protein BCR39DRAFT_38399 [Naematelia encephala]
MSIAPYTPRTMPTPTARPSSDLGTPTTTRQPLSTSRIVSSPISPSTPRRTRPLQLSKTKSPSPTSSSSSVQAFQRRHASEYAHLHKHSSESLRRARLEQEEARLAEERRLGREKRASLSSSSSLAHQGEANARHRDAWRPLSLLQHREPSVKGHSRSMSNDPVSSMRDLGGMRATSQPTRTRRLSIAPRIRSISERPPLPPARPSSTLEVLIESNPSPPSTPSHSSMSNTSSIVSKPGSTYSWATSFSGETSELRLASHYVPSTPPSPEQSEILSSAEKTQRRRKRVVAIAHTARQLEGVGSRDEEDPELYWTLQRAWNERPGVVAQAELLPAADLPPHIRRATGPLPYPLAKDLYLPPGAAPALSHSPNGSPAEPYFSTPSNQEEVYSDPSTYPAPSRTSYDSRLTGRTSARYSYASTLHDLAVDGGWEAGQRLMSEKAWLRTPQSDWTGWDDSVPPQSILSGPSAELQSTPRAVRIKENGDSPRRTTPERSLRKYTKPIQRLPISTQLSDAPPPLPLADTMAAPAKSWGLGISSWWASSQVATVESDFHLEPEPTPPDIPLPPTPPSPQMKRRRISKDSSDDLAVEIDLELQDNSMIGETSGSLSSSPFRQTWTHWSTSSLPPRELEAEVLVSGTLSARYSFPSRQRQSQTHQSENTSGEETHEVLELIKADPNSPRAMTVTMTELKEPQSLESEAISRAESGTLDPTQPESSMVVESATMTTPVLHLSPLEDQQRQSPPLLSGPLFSPQEFPTINTSLAEANASRIENLRISPYPLHGERKMRTLDSGMIHDMRHHPETREQERDMQDEEGRHSQDEEMRHLPERDLQDDGLVGVRRDLPDEGRLVWEYQQAAAAAATAKLPRPMSRTDVEQGMAAPIDHSNPSATAGRVQTLFWLGWILPFLWLIGGWTSLPDRSMVDVERNAGVEAKGEAKNTNRYIAWARYPDPWVRRCRIAAVSSATVIGLGSVIAVVVYFSVAFG